MSSEGRTTEARRPRGGGRNKSFSGRDSNNKPSSSTPTRRGGGPRGPGNKEFFTDSTNTSYIPTPSPARPAASTRPRLAPGTAGGGKSFQAALKAALKNKDQLSPTAQSPSPRPKLHERSQSLASAPASATLTTKRSPIQVSELGSPTPYFRPASARDFTRTPSPIRRNSETFPLVSPASFISESSEPPEALPEIYRQIESEEFLADASGGTDDDLSGSVKSSPNSRRLKRISGSPSGLSNSIRAFSPSLVAEELRREKKEEEEEDNIEKLDLGEPANTEEDEEEHAQSPELAPKLAPVPEQDRERDIRPGENSEKLDEALDSGVTDLPQQRTSERETHEPKLPQLSETEEAVSSKGEELKQFDEAEKAREEEIKQQEEEALDSGASSPFEEIVPEDPEMLARDEQRVKELIRSDRKAFGKASWSSDANKNNKKVGFGADIIATAAALPSSRDVAAGSESGGSLRRSQSTSSGKESEPSVRVPSTWGRKARSNPRWMEEILRVRHEAETSLSDARANHGRGSFGQHQQEDTAKVGSSAASRSVSSWLRTAAATPLPEAVGTDSLESTPAVAREAGDKEHSDSKSNDAPRTKAVTTTAFGKSRQWESRRSEGSSGPASPEKPTSPYRDHSIERLEKSAVATSRLNALGHANPARSSVERLAHRRSEQSLGSGGSVGGGDTRELVIGDEIIPRYATATERRSARSSFGSHHSGHQNAISQIPTLSATTATTDKRGGRTSPSHHQHHQQQSSPEVSPTRIPRIAQKPYQSESGSHHASITNGGRSEPIVNSSVTAHGEQTQSRASAVTSRLKQAFGKAQARARGSELGFKAAASDDQLIPSIEEEREQQQSTGIPSAMTGAVEENEGEGSDSRELLRRFARASSSSPAPPSRTTQQPPPPPLPKDYDLNGSVKSNLVGQLRSTAAPALEKQAQALPSADSSTEASNEKSMAATPAVKAGGVYLKTPKVSSGGWVDTPAAGAATAGHLQAIAEGGSAQLQEEYDEGSLLEAARIVMGTDRVNKVGPRLRSPQEMEALARTAPQLPHSALSDIVEHARRKNRGEESSEGEETLQLGDATLQSLEALLIKDEQEAWEHIGVEVTSQPSATEVAAGDTHAASKSTEKVSKIMPIASKSTPDNSNAEHTASKLTHEESKNGKVDVQSKAAKTTTKSPKQEDDKQQKAKATEAAGQNPLVRRLSKFAQVFTGKKSEPNTQQQLEQLSKLSVPATKIGVQEQSKTRLREGAKAPAPDPPSDETKAPASITTASKTSASESPSRQKRPSLSVQVDDSPKQSYKAKRAVAVVAPDEECDLAGEFHDFIWPCENCRRRAKSGKPHTEADTLGVVQWQTIEVPRLWRWPTKEELLRGQRVSSGDSSSGLWLTLRTWIPRLTLLGWLVLLVGGYALLEYNVTAAYTPPFYAESMAGFGVDVDAPRPPLVLLKLIWRSPLCFLPRLLWSALCIAIRTVAVLIGLSDDGSSSSTGLRPGTRWVYKEVWEDVGEYIIRAQLDHPEIVIGGERVEL